MATLYKIGSKSQAVQAIQIKLNQLMCRANVGDVSQLPALTTDGVYGTATFERVKLFQKLNGLKADGIVGPLTMDVMQPPLPYKGTVRGKVEPLRQKDKVERALMCNGGPIKYHLEYPNGGTDPEAPMPCDEQTGQLDCAGFVAWVNGYDRKFLTGMSPLFDAWGGYCNTDSTIQEAERYGELFTIIPLEEAQPGDIIVSASFRRKLPPFKRVIGHTGVIVDVGDTKQEGLKALLVVHCGSSNHKLNEQGSAVWKTSGALWKNYPKTLIVRFNSDYAYRKYLDLQAVRA